MMISLKLKNKLKFVSLISGMISSIIIDKTSMLQVALADLINEMRLIEHLHEYGVTCTYTESRRFKTYAAAANKELVNLEATNGLIQASCDNFDANLSTQNGLKQSHSLATIFIQNSNIITKRKPIPRLTKTDVSNVQLEEPQIHFYTGEKNPHMPASHFKS